MNEHDRRILIQRGLMPPTKRIDSLLDSGATEQVKRQPGSDQAENPKLVTAERAREITEAGGTVRRDERYTGDYKYIVVFMPPTEQTHDFNPGQNSAVCVEIVDRPDGSAELCGEPIKSPVHDPAAYLAYAAELGIELTDPQARMLAEYVYAVRNGRWSIGAKQSSELRSRLYDRGLLVGRDSWPYHEVSDLGAAALLRWQGALGGPASRL